MSFARPMSFLARACLHRSPWGRLGSRRGFSLAEIAIAVIILGAALIPIYSIFISGSKAATSSRLAYIAQHIARETMEEARQIPPEKLSEFAEKVNGGGSGPAAVTGPLYEFSDRLRHRSGGRTAVSQADSPQYPEEYQRFLRKMEVTDVDGKPMLKKVVLEVHWQEKGGSNEKPIRAMTKFITMIGQHAIDPPVREDE